MNRFHNTRQSPIYLVLLLGLSLMAAGCGVDFVTPPPAKSNPSNLAGTWGGTIEDAKNNRGVYESFFLTFDSSGQITSALVGGAELYQNGTAGSVTGTARLFSLTLNPAAGGSVEGGFYTDASFQHGGFVDANMNVAVLQKNGTSPAGGYDFPDIQGSHLTSMVDIDPVNFQVTGILSSTIDINGSNTFSGTIPITATNFVGTLDNIEFSYGGFSGLFTTPAGGMITVILSPDKAFAGSYACAGATFDFATCVVRVWNQ